jgi:flagellar biosynthetic protein FliR
MNWQVPTDSLLALLLGMVRASAWIVFCPPFNSRTIPAQVKALLAVAIALPMTPKLRGQVPAAETGPILVAAAEQVVVGVALGFITALFFAAVQVAGDLLDTFGGFSLAAAFDPFGLAQSSVFGRFYNIVAMTLLFGTDLFQVILRGFLETYEVLPLSGVLSFGRLNQVLTEGLGHIFVAGLQIAGPLIAVLFLTDVAFGLLNRVAPALNAFSLGFPAKIFLTFALSGTAIAVLPQALDNLIDKAVAAVLQVAGQ